MTEDQIAMAVASVIVLGFGLSMWWGETRLLRYTREATEYERAHQHCVKRPFKRR